MSAEGITNTATSPGRYLRLRGALGRTRKRTLLARMGLFFLLLGSVAAILFLTLRADRTDDWVEHTLRVRGEIEGLLGSLREAEGAQRGYLLTGDATYLNPYRPAVALLPDQIDKLHALLSDNAGQTSRLDAAEALIKTRIAEMDETIELFAEGRQAEARIELERQGRSVSNSIVQRLNELDAEEVRNLVERQRNRRENRDLLLIAIISALVATGGLATALLRAEKLHVAELNAANAALEERVAARTAELEAERHRIEALLSDVNHRVGNNLSMVSSILALQGRKTNNREARDVLDAAREHIGAIGSAQRRLHLLAGRDTVRLDTYLEPLLEDLAELLPDNRISLKLAAEPMELESKDAVSIGIIVNELVTNAVKHAFPGEMRGTILIRAQPDGKAGGIAVEIVDNGVGNAPDNGDKEMENEGLGTIIVASMSRSLGTEIEMSPADPGTSDGRPGTKYRLLIPKKA